MDRTCSTREKVRKTENFIQESDGNRPFGEPKRR
jgi:hypothetical protein